MIQIYGGRMGSSLRAHWMLAELSLPYENPTLDIRGGEHKKDEYLKKNPAGQIPVLIDGNFALPESIAIVQYLAEKHAPALLGATAEDRAQGLRWSLWTILNPQQNFTTAAMPIWRGAGENPETTKAEHEKAAQHLQILEQHLAGKDYILGTEFSTADINCAVGIQYGTFTKFDFSAFVNISRWLETVTARPAFKTASGK